MKTSVELPLLLFVFSFVFLGCPDNGVAPPVRGSLEIISDEVVTTHAYFTLRYSSSDSITVRIQRDGKTLIPLLSFRGECAYEDTLLEPATTYSYRAERVDNGDTSPMIRITTLPATSHEFEWQTTRFGGDAGTCSFSGVTVVNDSLIYAVGELHIKDASPEGWHDYNAARWNGKKWELLEIPVQYWGGGVAMGTIPLFGTISFAPDNVWYCSRAGLIQWDGTHYKQKAFFALSLPFYGHVSTMYGTPPDDIYCGGENGAFYHYRAGAWQQLDLGTKVLGVSDIWGIGSDESSNMVTFVSLAYDPFSGYQPPKFVSITKDGKVDSLRWNPQKMGGRFWTSNGKTFYIAHGGMFIYRNNTVIKEQQLINIILGIRGNDQNDIVAVGDYCGIVHFNGIDWKRYYELADYNGIYYAVAMKNNTVAAVGYSRNGAIVTIGRRNLHIN